MKRTSLYLLITLLLLSFTGLSNCSNRKKAGVLSRIVPLGLLGTGKSSSQPINKTYPTEETIVLNIGQQLTLSPSLHVEGSTYTISPQLPDGLSLDPNTGIINGSPTASFPATVFTITQTKPDGTKTSWKVIIGVKGNEQNSPTAESGTPTFNLPAGYYNEPKYISITTSLLGGTVRCTFDGTEPSSSSEEFTEPLHIWSIAGKTLKCRTFKDGTSVGETVTAFYSYPPLKTGQATVFQEGDDASSDQGVTRSYTGPTPHTTYTNDYTTIDNSTGLIWNSCSQGQSGANCDGTPIKLNFNNAGDDPTNGCSSLNFFNNGNGYAGRTNWRLPTIDELATIVDEGRSSRPTIDITAFPSTQSFIYWSSSVQNQNMNNIWTVSFDYGGIVTDYEFDSIYVRCVSGRSRNTDKSFIDNGDGTILDKTTSLTWQKCTAGQNNDSACSESYAPKTWTNALGYCNSLSLGGKNWRLPNKNELMSIVDYSKNTAFDTSFFPASSTYYPYWTSTSYLFLTNQAMMLSYLGEVIPSYWALFSKITDLPVRCVAGQ